MSNIFKNLLDRLHKADEALRGIPTLSEKEQYRIKGKSQGVRLAVGYVEEAMRDQGICVGCEPYAIDAEHVQRQWRFSAETFGPPRGTGSVVAHIRKELDEIEADPTDLMEWVDVIILGFDGALRAGHAPQAIIDAIRDKQITNEMRDWPDWRDIPDGQPIEHVRN